MSAKLASIGCGRSTAARSAIARSEMRLRLGAVVDAIATVELKLSVSQPPELEDELRALQEHLERLKEGLLAELALSTSRRSAANG